MIKTNRSVQDYITATKNIWDYFNVEDEFYIRPMTQFTWAIKNEEDFYFLSYWDEHGEKNSAVIVKKNERPMIYETNEHTMVIGIDCVKIGFIFENRNKNTNL